MVIFPVAHDSSAKSAFIDPHSFWQSEFAATNAVSHILTSRGNAQILNSIVERVSVDVVDFHPLRDFTFQHRPDNAMQVKINAIDFHHPVNPMVSCVVNQIASPLPIKSGIERIRQPHTNKLLNRPLFPVKLSIPVFQKLVQFSLARNLLEHHPFGGYHLVSNNTHFNSFWIVVVRSGLVRSLSRPT